MRLSWKLVEKWQTHGTKTLFVWQQEDKPWQAVLLTNKLDGPRRHRFKLQAGKKTSGDVTELVVYSDAQIVALTAKALHGGDVIWL